jgi:excisionase family DNA binding protein
MSALADEIKAAVRDALREELPVLLRAHCAHAQPPAIAQSSRPLSVGEAAQLAHRHPDTVRRAIHSGALLARRPGGGREWVIAPADLRRWMDRPGTGKSPVDLGAEVEVAVRRLT